MHSNDHCLYPPYSDRLFPNRVVHDSGRVLRLLGASYWPAVYHLPSMGPHSYSGRDGDGRKRRKTSCTRFDAYFNADFLLIPHAVEYTRPHLSLRQVTVDASNG